MKRLYPIICLLLVLVVSLGVGVCQAGPEGPSVAPPPMSTQPNYLMTAGPSDVLATWQGQ